MSARPRVCNAVARQTLLGAYQGEIASTHGSAERATSRAVGGDRGRPRRPTRQRVRPARRRTPLGGPLGAGTAGLHEVRARTSPAPAPCHIHPPGSATRPSAQGRLRPRPFHRCTHARGYKVVGVDWGKRTVKRLQSRFPEVEFRYGDVRSLPYESGSFDAVYSPDAVVVASGGCSPPQGLTPGPHTPRPCSHDGKGSRGFRELEVQLGGVDAPRLAPVTTCRGASPGM